MVRYKTKCSRCRKNYVLVGYKTRFPVCYECHKKEMVGEIKGAKFKKLFDIPEELYKQSAFLRDIKIKYLQFGALSDAQIAAFKKVVEKLKNPEKS